MLDFILSTRAKSPNLYVSFKNPLTGKYGTKRSTGTSDHKQAEKIAYKWLIVGTPTWSQDVNAAADNPITDYANVMYTLHFYAGSHGKPIMEKAEYAVSRGLPLFVTEWGTTLYTGDQFKPKTTIPWIEFMDRNMISWANWSVSNDGKESSILVYKTDREGKGGWTDEQISPSGKFIRGVLRNQPVKRLVREAAR